MRRCKNGTCAAPRSHGNNLHCHCTDDARTCSRRNRQSEPTWDGLPCGDHERRIVRDDSGIAVNDWRNGMIVPDRSVVELLRVKKRKRNIVVRFMDRRRRD